MERILVAMTGEETAFQALSRACYLARRIEAQIDVLQVHAEFNGRRRPAGRVLAGEAWQRLLMQVERSRWHGITINLYQAEGKYEEEVLRFARQNKITLMLFEAGEGDGRTAARLSRGMISLLHRLSCRVEVVVKRKTIEPFAK